MLHGSIDPELKFREFGEFREFRELSYSSFVILILYVDDTSSQKRSRFQLRASSIDTSFYAHKPASSFEKCDPGSW